MSELERIAAALEKIASNGSPDSPTEQLGTVHLFYAQRIENIITGYTNYFELVKSLRTLQTMARQTAENMLNP